MKTRTLPFLSILFLLPLLYASFPQPSTKKLALIVAVGNYPEAGKWNRLAAENDVKVIKSTLLDQGFSPSEVQLVQDAAATRQGILQAFENLYEKAGAGDQVFFHFSGHGQQIQDDNGDELDGYDEAVVPYDSPKYFEKGTYEGEHLIRDEEIGYQLNRIRRKIGPKGHLLAVIDACHSGTGTRGLGNTRGTHIIMADSAYILQQQYRGPDNNSLMSEAPAADMKDLAPMVAFFSAAAGQLSYEYKSSKGQSYGILSYAFSKAMQLSGPNITYRGLFDKIRATILASSPQQTPQAEGELDKPVMNGEYIPGFSYFSPAEFIDGRNLTVDAGEMQGLFKDTKLGLFPIETRNFKQIRPKAVGYVNYATLLDCNVELQNSLSKEDIYNSWIYVLEPKYGPISLDVQIDLPEGRLKDELIDLINSTGAIQMTSTRPDLLIEQKKAEGGYQVVQMISDQDRLIMQEKFSSGDPVDLAQKALERMIRFAQAEYLRKAGQNEADQQLELEFLYNGRWISGAASPVFKLGEAVQVRIQNKGTWPLYVSLINIQSDDQLNLVIPWDRAAEEYYLKAGGSYVFEETLYARPPTGVEVFKLIGSERPLDWSALLTNWNAVMRGPKQGTVLDMGPGSVVSVFFRIIE